MSGVDTSATQVNGLPGYNAMVRRLAAFHDFKGMFGSLELFTVEDAESFLHEKLDAAVGYKNPERRQAALTEIVLGFAILCVFAERENVEFLAEIDPKICGAPMNAEIERAIEEEEINPPKDISW